LGEDGEDGGAVYVTAGVAGRDLAIELYKEAAGV
jgi:hypothetical protein